MSDEIKIRWADLGPPTRPCELDYYGRRVIVTARDIEVAGATQMPFSQRPDLRCSLKSDTR